MISKKPCIVFIHSARFLLPWLGYALTERTRPVVVGLLEPQLRLHRQRLCCLAAVRAGAIFASHPGRSNGCETDRECDINSKQKKGEGKRTGGLISFFYEVLNCISVPYRHALPFLSSSMACSSQQIVRPTSITGTGVVLIGGKICGAPRKEENSIGERAMRRTYKFK